MSRILCTKMITKWTTLNKGICKLFKPSEYFLQYSIFPESSKAGFNQKRLCSTKHTASNAHYENIEINKISELQNKIVHAATYQTNGKVIGPLK